MVTFKTRSVREPDLEPVHISHVDVRGVRILKHLEFAVPPSSSPEEGQWLVILGENGTGKTTLLRALALTLARADVANTALSTLGDPFLAGPACGAGVRANARDYAYRTHDGQPSRLDLPRDRAHVDVFGYGARRGGITNLEHHGDPRERDALDTLFESRVGLVDTQGWLRWAKLADEKFPGMLLSAKRAVESLLPGGETLEFDGPWVRVRQLDGSLIPLPAMSEGYLTTMGWTLDLLARWIYLRGDRFRPGQDFTQDMPCVVLVDEIDLHLHPRWQLDIIPRLRKAFPKTTFIVTTHNPLTLHGTRPGEVFVLQRDDEGKVSIVQRDVPLGLDANKLLTGDWFGLASTLDEDTLALLDRHRALLWAKKPDQDRERLELEERIRQRLGRFADTSLERLAQSVAVEVLYRENEGRPRDVTDAQREEIVKRVRTRLAERDARATSAKEPQAPYGRRRSAEKKPARPAGVRTSAGPSKRGGTAKPRAVGKRR